MKKGLGIALALGLVGVGALILIPMEGPTVHSEEHVRLRSIRELSPAQWEKLARARVYFGHQSVGSNIINGLRDILGDDPQRKLNIVETSDPGHYDSPVFGHSRIGRNGDPKSKITAFSGLMDGGIASKVDVAFLKLCYVDVTEETNATAVFREYKEAMSRLHAKYPETVFVHVTVPLTSMDRGIKLRIKKIIGRSLRYEDNIRRRQFNELLRGEYQSGEPIFDLAKIEATPPDGRRRLYRKGGDTFHAMAPSYTDDGGHLNRKGRKMVAEQLLLLLADLTEHVTR